MRDRICCLLLAPAFILAQSFYPPSPVQCAGGVCSLPPGNSLVNGAKRARSFALTCDGSSYPIFSSNLPTVPIGSGVSFEARLENVSGSSPAPITYTLMVGSDAFVGPTTALMGKVAFIGSFTIADADEPPSVLALYGSCTGGVSQTLALQTWNVSLVSP